MFAKLTLLLCVACVAWAWPTGAPIEACDDSTPNHNVEGQTSEPPYIVSLSASSASAGTEVKLSVRGNSTDDLIKGFLAQAFADEGRVGTFKINESDDFIKGLDCGNVTDSAATHKRRVTEGVSSLDLTWITPSGVRGMTNFTITLVKERTLFWIAVPAGQLNIV